MPDPETEEPATEEPAIEGPATEEPAGPESPPAAPAAGGAGAQRTSLQGPPDEMVVQRLRQALFRPSRAQLIVGVLLAVLGFAAITQVRTNNTDDTYAGYREQDLVDVLSGLSDATQRAQTEIDNLEASRRNLERNREDQSAALAAAQKQAQELAILAGTVPVTGPGIRLTVTEGPRAVDVDAVLDTVEELRSAGAEAMQVNGRVRLVAQSSIEPAQGGGLRIDGTLVTSPYVFDVIGDPRTLSGALKLVGGPIAQFSDDGAGVSLESHDSLDITAVRQLSTSQ